ncbi:hypothetical protein NYG90_08505 [Helicobacter sp. XJK30-2]|uniref:Uncharacterized protein n=1 Tax=Helicobacter zhangjianzhongii TaxID=2974574 RepID=A0ACC6FUQ3_9HELI|nr:hypothetical protein [Helicobacter sp. XJK30-2]MDL0082705.1 hypothetical protein [Helicobacter sp. XJK30-2]
MSKVDSRILEIESWLFEPRKEIRLEVYRRSAAMKSAILAQKLNPPASRICIPFSPAHSPPFSRS